MNDVTDEVFAAALQAAGLRGDWEKDGDDRYTLTTAWWQSFSVFGGDGDWVVWQYDHDAGISECGGLITACDQWDEHYHTWIDAAKDIEELYLK